MRARAPARDSFDCSVPHSRERRTKEEDDGEEAEGAGGKEGRSHDDDDGDDGYGGNGEGEGYSVRATIVRLARRCNQSVLVRRCVKCMRVSPMSCEEHLSTAVFWCCKT